MAKKNEILLSIALEGDAEVKSKLAAVGEISKKSLADTEKKLGEAGSRIGKQLAEPLGQVSEALAPLLEEAGFARLGTVLGSGGLFARFSGAAGPAAAVAALSGLALHLAKVSEESERADARLKALGGGSKALDQLNESAKKIGVSPSGLQGSLEDFLSNNRRQRVEDDAKHGISYAPGYEPPDNQPPLPTVFQGGKQVSGSSATKEEFLAAQRTLRAGAQAEHAAPEAAQAAIDAFLHDIEQPHAIGTNRFTGQPEAATGLTSDAIRALSKAFPPLANRVARSIGDYGGLGRGFPTSEDLAVYLDKTDRKGLTTPIAPSTVFKSLKQEEPRALKDAAAARGVSDAFEGLRAATGRLEDTFGKAAGGEINKALTNSLDKVSGFASGAADLVEHSKESVEKGAKLGRELGSAAPIPFLGTPGALLGGVAGIGADLVKERVLSPLDSASHNTLLKASPLLGAAAILPDLFGLRNQSKSDVAQDQFQRLFRPLTNPAAIAGNVPEQGGRPSQLTPDSLARTKIPSPLDLFRSPAQETAPAPSVVPPPFVPDRTLDGLQIAPPQQPPPLPQDQTPPPAPPQQFGDVGAAIGEALRGLFQTITEKANSLNPQDTRVHGPVDGLGIRGEGPQDTTSNVAELNGAAGEATESLKQLASAASSASGSVGSPAPATATVHAAGGGFIKWLDSGGNVAGAGTATSDSIPAMLSDGEYVIKASSARKLGRGMLDHLNAGGNYAGGGEVARKLAAVRRRYADGGAVSPSEDSSAITDLPAGSYDVTPTDDGGAIVNGVYYGASAPLLQNPLIQQALRRARQDRSKDAGQNKHHSDFTGRFGHDDSNGAIDTYVATGGLVTPHGVLRGGAAHFAAGGAVGSIPHLAIGGSVSLPGLDFSSLAHLAGGGPAPTLDSIDAGASGGPSGHLSVDLRTNHGDYKMMAPEDVARQMSRAAVASSSVQTSPRPSWFGGD